MPHVEPLRRDDLPEHELLFQVTERILGYLPNSELTMARQPGLLEGFHALATAVVLNDRLDAELLQLVANVASTAAGCRYCQSHTATVAARQGAEDEKVEALWNFERSERFSEPERAALRLARDAAQNPNATGPEHFDELRQHFTDDQIVGIVAVIALFGFLNRWNDTMATDLEAVPSTYGAAHLAASGWTPGRHAPDA